MHLNSLQHTSVRLVANITATLHRLVQQLRLHVQSKANLVALAFAAGLIGPRPPLAAGCARVTRACSRRPPLRKLQKKTQRARPWNLWYVYVRGSPGVVDRGGYWTTA